MVPASLHRISSRRTPFFDSLPVRTFLKALAESAKVTRQFPGSNDTDFSSYFNALNKIGYTGGVSCECGWGDKQDLEKNLTIALTTLKKFAGQA